MGAAIDLRANSIFSPGSGMRTYIEGLDPSHTPPSPNTSKKIRRAAYELMREDIIADIYLSRGSYDRGFLSGSTDGWKSTATKTHFDGFGIGFTAQRNEGAKYVDIVLSVEKSEGIHCQTGAAIARAWDKIDQRFDIKPADYLSRACDGASNNGVANRILNERPGSHADATTCIPHDLMSAAGWAQGTSGKTSLNPVMSDCVMKNRLVATKIHQSTNATNALTAVQLERGLPEEGALGCTIGASTRWRGDLQSISRVNVLRKDLDDAAAKLRPTLVKEIGPDGRETADLPESKVMFTDDQREMMLEYEAVFWPLINTLDICEATNQPTAHIRYRAVLSLCKKLNIQND